MAGIDREKVASHAQMLALGTLIGQIMAEQFKASGDADRESRKLLDLYERMAEQITFDGVDASMSDYASAEYRDVLVRHVLRARALATGEKLDPDAYRRSWRIGP